jgi:hypothetical protein
VLPGLGSKPSSFAVLEVFLHILDNNPPLAAYVIRDRTRCLILKKEEKSDAASNVHQM